MAAGFTITIDDHSPEILRALENAVNRGLKACGEKAVDYAKDLVPKKTGNLSNHINYEVDGDECVIGVTTMTPPYGIYVEFGTGKGATTGGRKTKWVYRDANGQFHTTSGMEARPFIKPAAADHADEYRKILINSLKNA